MPTQRRNAARNLSTREQADQLKERIYLIFAALAVTLALSSHDEVTASEGMITLGVTLLGTVLAIFTADLIAHFLVHEQLPTRKEFAHTVRASFGALPAVALPFIFLIISAFTKWDADSALLASAIALAGSLVLLTERAVRRLKLGWWKRTIILGAEAVLALAVIGLQVLAHG